MRTVNLGEISSPKQWRALSKTAMTESGYPVYGANGQIGWSDEYTHEQPVIAVGCRGTIGNVHLTEPRSFVTSNAMALDSLRTDLVDPKYLMFFLSWRGFRDVTSGSSQPQLTRQNMVGVEVPLPGLEEQRRIAAILDQADTIRTKRRQVLTHLDALPMTWFREFEGGSYPRSPLGVLGRVTTGRTPPSKAPNMFGGPIPFVTPGDLEVAGEAARTLTEEGAVHSRTVEAEATLVCCIGTIGKVDSFPTRVAFNQQINAIEWGDRVDPTYGQWAVKYLQPLMAARGGSTTLPLLPKSRFAELTIQVPPMREQRRFAETVSRLRALTQVIRHAVGRDDDLFASLQSRAFRGEL